MAAKVNRGAVALSAMALVVCVSWWPAHAQVKPASQVPAATRDPGYELGEAGRKPNTIDCMGMLGNCNEKAKACETQRAHCEASEAMARDQLHAAFAELEELRPKAALPLCSDRKDWLHAVLPTVHCYPYACGDTPFSCTQHCNSKLDCAPGRSCSAQGQCVAPL
jgi:hypothetical protein